MTPLHTIIVEDDHVARMVLEEHCKKDDRIEWLGSFPSGEEALEFLSTNNVDLIFLDVELTGISGLELLESSFSLPQVIFASSHSFYALDAFKHEATDFLEKPILQAKFEASVQKAVNRFMTATKSIHNQESLFVRVNRQLIQIEIKDILYIENVGDYIKVVTNEGRYVTHNTMRDANIRLSIHGFFKVHRSYIVNLRKIDKIQNNVITIGTTVIPVSRSNRQSLINRLRLL